MGEGAPCAEVRVLLMDAPLPPANLAADYSSSGFYIKWDASTETAVTGYIVDAKIQGEWRRVYDGSNDPSITRVNI